MQAGDDQSDCYAVESSTPLSHTPLSSRTSTFRCWTRAHRSSPAGRNQSSVTRRHGNGYKRSEVTEEAYPGPAVCVMLSPVVSFRVSSASQWCSASCRTLSALPSPTDLRPSIRSRIVPPETCSTERFHFRRNGFFVGVFCCNNLKTEATSPTR